MSKLLTLFNEIAYTKGMDVNKKLINLGLTEKESAVYMACLQLGEGLISDIANAAKIKRPTTYNIIDDLIKKGIIEKVNTGTRSYYRAEDPEKLLEIFEKNKLAFKKSLPELEAIYKKKKSAPQIKFFEGVEAIKEMYDKLIKQNEKETFFITPIQEYQRSFPDLYRLHAKVVDLLNAKEKIIKEKFACVQIITKDSKYIISWKRDISVIQISDHNIIELERYLFHVEQ